MTGPNTTVNRRGSATTQTSFSKSPSMVSRSIVVGCPKEIKVQESRVGITPSCAAEYIANGHSVVIESGAGEGSGFPNEAYKAVGSTILRDAASVYKSAQMIVKVKEPIAPEYDLISEGQIIFAYFHFAASWELTEAMMKAGAVCIAYETVACKDRSLPLLTPMSEIAGRMSIQEGAKFLEKPMGGMGVLLSGVPGVHPARIVILGGGVVGFNAAKMAAGTGADVVILDINVTRLRYLDDVLPSNCRTLYCSSENVALELSKADLVIGAVLIPGAKAPKLVRQEHLKVMKPGALIVDVAIDQGGCFATSKLTTHDNPTFVKDGIVHYCVGNMPGAVPQTSTIALNNVTLKYGLELANKGWFNACTANDDIKNGLSIALGTIVCKGVSNTFGMPETDAESYLKEIPEATVGKAEMELSERISGLSVN